MGNEKKSVIIVSPSLDASKNVSGISTVTQFIIDNNQELRYIHFELGRKDNEHGGLRRIRALTKRYHIWKQTLGANPDAIIHYNLPLSKASLLRDPWFIRYAMRNHHKIIIHVHGGRFLTAKKVPLPIKPVLYWVFSLNVPFIVLSSRERKIIENRFGAKNVYILPNSVAIPKGKSFSLKEGRLDGRAPIRIGYLGRIEPNKGMTELLLACQKLIGEHFPFHLTLAGKEQTKDEYLPLFDQWLGSRFTYVGVVSGQHKADFLQNLDVFVLPSYFEGLPMSLLESMSYGVVPIVTPVGSIPEVVKDGENGLFIYPHDVDSIIKCIKKVDENRQLLENLGNNARNTIFEKFNPIKYTETLNKIYQEA